MIAQFYMLGVPNQTSTFELVLISNPSANYHELSSVLDAVNAALNDIQPFEEEAAPGKARRLSWQRFWYWNEAQDGVAVDVTDCPIPLKSPRILTSTIRKEASVVSS